MPTPPETFRGVRSFVPWKNDHILKWTLPSLTIDPTAVTIQSGPNTWAVAWPDISLVVADPKGILVKRKDGTAGRFKASKRTIRSVVRLLNDMHVPYSSSATSTYWMVTADRDSS